MPGRCGTGLMAEPHRPHLCWLADRVVPEDVVVADRGVVVLDVKHAEGVRPHAAAGRKIEAAAAALAVAAAAFSFPTDGVVLGDGAAGDGEGADAKVRAAVVVDAAPQAVAAVAAPLAFAATGEVIPHVAVDKCEGCRLHIRDAAAEPIPGAAADCSLAADGLVVRDRAVADCERASVPVLEPAAIGQTCERARISGAADGLIVGDDQVAGDHGARVSSGRTTFRRGPTGIADGAAVAPARDEVVAVALDIAATDGLVMVESAVGNRDRPTPFRLQPPAACIADVPHPARTHRGVGTANGLVVREGAAADGHAAGVIPDAAAQRCVLIILAGTVAAVAAVAADGLVAREDALVDGGGGGSEKVVEPAAEAQADEAI